MNYTPFADREEQAAHELAVAEAVASYVNGRNDVPRLVRKLDYKVHDALGSLRSCNDEKFVSTLEEVAELTQEALRAFTTPWNAE